MIGSGCGRAAMRRVVCVLAVLLWSVLSTAEERAAVQAPGLGLEVDLVLDDETEDYFIGRISSVVEDSRGDIYIADPSQESVLRFSAGGDFIGMLGTAGSGPGTIMPQFALAVSRDDRFYLTGQGGRVEILDAAWHSLVSLGRENPASSARGIAVFPDGGFAVAAAGQSTDTTVDLYGPDGSFRQSVSRAFTFDKGYPRRIERPFVGGAIAIGPSGKLYYAQMAPYLVRVFSQSAGQIDSTTVGGDEFVGYPDEPVMDGDSIAYRMSSRTSGIVVLDDGTVLVSAFQVESEETGKALYCAYDEDLEFLGSVEDPHLSWLVGKGRGNKAYLRAIGETGHPVLRAALTFTAAE